ncbi:MAG: peptide chain release factor N(5)-glutamine methyltransferase [Bacteroidetes bacterium]|nr:peptide chain release factor N(5)-glutamine methyltransferase [Bacteroidota bacterium]
MRCQVAAPFSSTIGTTRHMTRNALLESFVARLEDAHIEDARRNAEWIIENVLGLSKAALYAHADVSVTGPERERGEDLLLRRLRREPIQYVLEQADFLGFSLRVTPAVFIPRPETEEVVEEALRRMEELEAPWVLDVGTGSGAIALAIKYKRPDAEVFACDISEAALAVAAENAERLKLEVSFIHADALDPMFAHEVSPVFDVVVSNPPYIPDGERENLQPEVRAYEPGVALFVPDDDPLRFYRSFAGHAPFLLKPGGWFVVETHEEHSEDVRSLFADAELHDVALRNDLAGRPRIVSARYQAN